MSVVLSELVARVDAEPPGLDVNLFLSYLAYRSCKEDRRMLRDEAYIINTKSGATASVPIRYAMIDKELIYQICLVLGVNMPDEFTAFQQLMDSAKPEGYTPG
jgi:hypothetical protein